MEAGRRGLAGAIGLAAGPEVFEQGTAADIAEARHGGLELLVALLKIDCGRHIS